MKQSTSDKLKSVYNLSMTSEITETSNFESFGLLVNDEELRILIQRQWNVNTKKKE